MVALTLRLIASLAIVVGLLMLVVWAGRKRFGASRGRAIDVVHRQPLGRNSTVSVVNVGARTLVLGTTEQQVTMLTELDGDEAQALMAPVSEAAVDDESPAAPPNADSQRHHAEDPVSSSHSPSPHPSPATGPFPSHEEFAVYSNEQPAAQSANALPLDPELRARLLAALLESSAPPVQPQPQPMQPHHQAMQPQPMQPQAVYAPAPVLQPLPQALPPGYGAPVPPISAPVAQLLGQVVQSYLMGGYAAAPQYSPYGQPMLQLPAPYPAQPYAPQPYPAQTYVPQYAPAPQPGYEQAAYQQPAPATASVPQPDPATAQARLDEVLQQVMQVVEQRLAETQPPRAHDQAQTPRRASGAGTVMGYLGASDRRAAARRDAQVDEADAPEMPSSPSAPVWSPEAAATVADRPATAAFEAFEPQGPTPTPMAEQPVAPAAMLAAELDDVDGAEAGFEPWRPPAAGAHAARSVANASQPAPATSTEEVAEGLNAEQLREVIAALRAKAGTLQTEPASAGRRVATDRAVDSVSEAPVHAPKRAANLRAVPSMPHTPDFREPESHDFAAALEEALDSTDRVDLTLTAQGRASTVQAAEPETPSSQGPLDGSVLSPATWKQAFNAVRVR